MKRVALVVVGGALTLAGVALLVLPGPGFVLVAAGLALLATQFAWAARPLGYAKDKARTGIHELGQSRRRAALAVAGAVGLLAAGALEIVGVDLPLVIRSSGSSESSATGSARSANSPHFVARGHSTRT